MIQPPEIVSASTRPAAVIRLAIPRAEIRHVMGPAISEILSTVAGQGAAVSGPMFSHHLSMPSGHFDFNVGFPITGVLTPQGRVAAGVLPGGRAARTVYRGNYEGLPAAWGAFEAWLAAQKLSLGSDLWEVYVRGPEASADPSAWETELFRRIDAEGLDGPK
ncbi:MAG: GyrI-like domain-containing protein [Planctomycetota bacterium]|nr:GyrI-like domain-containing protein [Planctomycetota bacterium]